MNHAGRSRSLLAGAAMTTTVLAVALLALVWTPYPPTAIDTLHRLVPPNGAHPLGTDALGRDVLSMLMAGSVVSMSVAAVAVVVGAAIGIPLGSVAAALGGWVDNALMRAADLVFAFPALLTAVMVTALAGPGTRNAMLAIGIFNISVFARVTRASARAVWQRGFVLAARTAGRGDFAISVRHVLPNIASVLIVQATIQFAVAIVADAGLSYVGLGTQPPQPSWGRMLNESQSFIWKAPLLAVFPGLAITFAVLGLNLLGDGLQDVLDPRRRARE